MDVNNIKLLLMDVDGVLTEGDIIYGSSGLELKIFNALDGMGITLARAAGLKVGAITGRECDAVSQRLTELGFDEIIQNCPDKIHGYNACKKKYGLNDSEIAYIGDDIQDLPVLEKAGLPCGVNNSIEEVKNICVYTASLHGGKGAVREIINWILEKQNKKQYAIEKVLKQTKNPTDIKL